MADDQDDQQVTDGDQTSDPTAFSDEPSGDATNTSEQTMGDHSETQASQSDDQSFVEGADAAGQISDQRGTSGLSDSDKLRFQNLMGDPVDSEAAIPAKSKTGDCSGWESNPRGFAKAIADNYISTEFNRMPANVGQYGESCWASQPNSKGSDFCYLHYEDGWSVIVSLTNVPDYVRVRAVDPEMKQRCTYDYDCTGSGTLSFTKRHCEY
jgi:hypothetical protein